MTSCRSCYFDTLTEDERKRAAAERVTGPIHLCDDHQRGWDELMARLPVGIFTRASTGDAE